MKPISWKGPLFVLLISTLVFHPWVTQNFSFGWGEKTIFFSPQSFFFLSSLVLIWFYRLRWNDFYSLGSQFLKNLGLAFFLGVFPIALGLVGIFFFSKTHPQETILNPVFHLSSSQLFVLWIWAPVTEELFFRGLLLRSLREKYSQAGAIFWSSLLFSAAHPFGYPMIGPFLLGGISGWLTFRSNTLWPGTLFHFLTNTYAPLLMIEAPQIYQHLRFLYG